MMKGDILVMSEEERRRCHLLQMALDGRITVKDAGELMGVSYRHAKRLRRRYDLDGARGIVHGNRGKSPPNAFPQEVKDHILELSQGKYRDFNDTHFTEKLIEVEGIDISRETVRELRRSHGIKPKNKRRPKRHYRRRPRKDQEGMMVLWDGSPHRWFGVEYSPCCLMAAIDDATGTLVAARFFLFEGSEGYLWLLRHIVNNYGIPLSIYQDRHGSLCRNDDNWSLEEELAGKQEPTQVGYALEALGVRSIFALTPQAKGRVERLFKTLQDRLIAEMALNSITTIEAANRFLDTVFIKDFNKRFAVSAEEPIKAWRETSPHIDLERVIGFRYGATVGNDNTVRLGGVIIDIPPGPKRRSYAQAKVEVRQLLDGSWRVYYKDKLIATYPSTTIGEPIRALNHKRTHTKGAKSYSWVYMASQPIP